MEQNSPLSISSGSLLTVKEFKITDITFKNNNLYFGVDREIEFEVLAKIFTLTCSLEDQSSQVRITELHEF